MGASDTINKTGPSVIFAYLIAGMFLFLVMRAMGEMVYLHPTTGSFAHFASDYIHPVAGYITAWSNIFQWIVVGMSEVIAVGQYMNYCFPELPQWIPGVIVILLLAAANLVSVKAFGEFEFWFAMIKVVTIILMIIAGLGLIFFGLGTRHATGLSNLWTHGGFMPHGWVGFFFALSIVVASYQGVEFTKVMKNGVPAFAVAAISIGILVGALLNVILPKLIPGADNVFVYVYSASILPGMIPWFMILISHLRFRKLHPDQVEGHPFKMPGGAVGTFITIIFFILVLIGMLFNKEQVISLLIGVVFLAFMTAYYFIKGYHKMSEEKQRF